MPDYDDELEKKRLFCDPQEHPYGSDDWHARQIAHAAKIEQRLAAGIAAARKFAKAPDDDESDEKDDVL